MNLLDADDAQLVARAKAGDEEAFRILFKRHHGRVAAVTQKMLRRREEADDAVQDAFINAWRFLHTYDGRSRFSTWIHRIAINISIDRSRKRKSSLEVTLEEWENLEADTTVSPRPDQALVTRERERIVQEALDTLPPIYRVILRLREEDGMSYREISDYMGCPEGTVMSRLFYAHANLRRALKHAP